MPSKRKHSSYLRLVVDNSRRIVPSFRGRKVRPELLVGGGRELTTRRNPVKKLAVVDHLGRKPRKGDALSPRTGVGVPDQLFLECHSQPSVSVWGNDMGFIPQSSRGFIPRAPETHMRDNARMDLVGLKTRLRQRIAQKGLSMRRVAELADVSDSYLSQIATGKSKKPTAERLGRVALVLDTTLNWLQTGEGPEDLPASTEEERELLALFRQIPENQRDHGMAVLRALAATPPTPKAQQPKKTRA